MKVRYWLTIDLWYECDSTVTWLTRPTDESRLEFESQVNSPDTITKINDYEATRYHDINGRLIYIKIYNLHYATRYKHTNSHDIFFNSRGKRNTSALMNIWESSTNARTIDGGLFFTGWPTSQEDHLTLWIASSLWIYVYFKYEYPIMISL